jgi:L-arabinose isomerase
MNTDIFTPLELWFVVGSQHLYCPEALAQVAANGAKIAEALDQSPKIPDKIVFKHIVTKTEQVYNF